MEINYKNWDWNSVGKVDVAEEVFNAALRKDIIARVIRWQQAKSRSGNHSTKTISMISGTTKKPFAQKGGGRARQGSLRSPQFRGGSTVFGPHPRDHSHKLNKKVRKLGCVSSLTYKMKEELFWVMESLEFPFEKTSKFASWLENRQFKSVLFVLSNEISDDLHFKCIKNIPYCDVIPVKGLNVLDIVKHKNIICDLASLKEIEARFSDVSNRELASVEVKKEKGSKDSEEIVMESKKTVKAKGEEKASKPVAKKTTAKKGSEK